MEFAYDDFDCAYRHIQEDIGEKKINFHTNHFLPN